MPFKLLTPTQKDEIARRFKEGELKQDIAKAMGLHVSSVIRYTPKTYKHLSPEKIQEIVKDVESGLSKIAVAEKHKLGLSTVSKHTRHIRLAPPETPPDKQAEIARRALAGEPVVTIARDINVSHQVARRIAKKAMESYKIRKQQVAKIHAAWERGKSIPLIATSLSIPQLIVKMTLGIDGPQQYSEGLRRSAITAMELGESAKAVSKRLGVAHQSVCDWFNAAVASGEVERPDKPPQKGDDLQFRWITRLDSGLEEWRELIVQWFEAEEPPAGAAIQAASLFFEKYLIPQGLPKKPADLLLRGRLLPDFYEVACPKTSYGRQCNSRVYEFVEWVLDSPAFADVEGEEPIRNVDLYRNPINPNAGETDSSVRHTESNKVVLPYFLISDLRKRIVQGPTFKDWKWLQGLTGYETSNGTGNAPDWFPVSHDMIDPTDPDCVWRLRQRVRNTSILEMWSPVRWVHALVHLQTTVRSGQLRVVDSGEADTLIWHDGQFIPNSSSLKEGSSRKPRRQGVFRRPSEDEIAQGAVVSLYFNTNKTKDRNKSGIAKGTECPWPQMQNIDEDPYYWLAKLRDWQAKYNPIESLTRWRDLRGQAKLSAISEVQASQYPDAAFLFRAPEKQDHPNWPIPSHDCYKAWQKLLSAYQDLLKEEGIKHPSGEAIELINPINGAAWSSPHATRTSLITHLIIDGNVPPVIMMKIAGHARFIMTVYYTKAGLAGIQNAIKAGAEKIEAAKYQTFERDLLGASAEQMREKVVFNAEDWKTVLPANPDDRTPLGWLHQHDGICLAGGNTGGDPSIPGCHNGGGVLITANKTNKGRHGPVSGGIRNCCRCRWKASGKQHILGLAATYDNRAYHMHKAKDEAIDAERERNRLMRDKARVELANAPYTRMRELIDAERLHEAAMHRFEELALDVVALHRTIERVMALPENTDGPTALAAQGDLVSVNMIIENTESELLQLATICADIEIFPDLDRGTAVFEFAQLIDQAFEREGQPLVLARLSEREKLVAANAIMRELERKANPDNLLLGRRMVVEIMDRGESIQHILGINIANVITPIHNTPQSGVPVQFAKNLEG